MRYTIVLAALCTMALGACDRPAAVTPSAPVVVVPAPGPAGPQGAQGTPAEKGATGAPGMTGAEGARGEQGKQSGDTIVVVPAPASQR